MSDEFIAALALTERVRDYEAAIKSFDQAIVNGDEIRRERDDALATIARVQAALYPSDSPALVVDRVRKALKAAQGEAQGATGATRGELHPCEPRPDSVPAAGLTGGTP